MHMSEIAMSVLHKQGDWKRCFPGKLLCALSIAVASATWVHAQTFPPDNIAVELEATVDEVGLGGLIPYRLQIINSNSENFDVTGQIPAPEFTRIASGLTCESTLQECTEFESACSSTGCSFSVFLFGSEQVEIGYAARVRDDVPSEVEEILAEAVVSFPQFESSTTASTTTPIFRTPPDLAVEVSVGDVLAFPGEPLGYQIGFSNQGQLPADDTQLIATVPAHASFASGSSDGWACAPDDLAGSECRLPLDTVEAGASGAARFTINVDPELPVDVDEIVFSIEIAMAAGDDGDADPSDNVAVEHTRVLHDDGIPVPGDPVDDPGFLSVIGDASPQRVGQTVSGGGDINGDGLTDALVGAPGSDAVFLIRGRSLGGGIEVIPASTFPTPGTTGHVVKATDGFGGLGDRLAGIGDINGDGLADLAYADAAIDLSPLTGRTRGAFVTPGFDMVPGTVSAPDNRFVPEEGPVLEPRSAAGPFATEVAGVGDVNADGLNDFALTYIAATDGFPRQTVFVLFGHGGLMPFQPDTIIVEDAVAAAGVRVTDAGFPEGRFGEEVSRIGDFNADGIDDFAIAAPGRSSGTLFVIFGSPGLGGSEDDLIDVATLDGINGFALTAGAEESGFGARVAAAGDFNGDLVDDLLVAVEPAADAPGRVYVVFGTPLSLPPAATLGESGPLEFALIDGAAPNDLFGHSLDSAGDLNGDGFDDLVIGAPGLAQALEPGMPAPGSGRVFVIFGPGGGNGISGADSVAGLVPDHGFSLAPPVPASGFGASVTGLGDFGGNGVPDYGVGAPGRDNGELGDSGQIWIVSGALRPGPEAIPVEIQEFSVDPASLFVGNDVEIGWSASPDDAMTACTGSGLPGTSWDGSGKPASGTVLVDTTPLAPGMYVPRLTCERDGETASAEATLAVLEPPVEIQEFSVDPASLFVGNDVEIGWSASPDDAMTACTGSGLPGTSWDGSGKPASGTVLVDTTPLAPGMYVPRLTCERDGETASAEATLEVLEPPATLELSGAVSSLTFFDDAFVQLDLANVGDIDAEQITLDVGVPENYQPVDIFRLAGSCSAADSGEVSCDPDSIPAWQCQLTDTGVACALAELPAGGTAALVVQLNGQGEAELSGLADAANASASSALISIPD